MMSDHTWNFDYPQIARDSGFKFRQHNNGDIDWRHIGGIETEKIIKNQNIEKLDSIINHLAEVPLGSLLNSNILESGIAKYFILSQLALQYLIFCKRFLDETVTSMRNTLKELQTEKMQCKKLEQEHAEDILRLHKELQKLRNISEIVFPCSMCTKNFVSNEMLNIHISRKHSNEIKLAAAASSQQNRDSSDKRITEKENDRNLISTIKLELEIKHLKERLNDAEKIIRNQKFEISKPIEEIKGSPRSYIQIQELSTNIQKEKTAKTVATQNEFVSTKTIGIQSNLSEEKETDDIDAMEKKNILEIFKEINEKINKLEKVRNDDTKKREEAITKFESKLQDVTESLEAKQQHNLEILNKFTDKMSSQTSLNQDTVNLEEIKEYLNNTVEKIKLENKKQLHQIVEKFDKTLLDKMNVLKIDKSEKIIQPKEITHNSSQDLKSDIRDDHSDIKLMRKGKKEILKENIILEDHIESPKAAERNDNSKIQIIKNPHQIRDILPKKMVHLKSSEITMESSQSEETSQSSDDDSETLTSGSNSSDSNDIKNAKRYKIIGSNKLALPKQNEINKKLMKDKTALKLSSTPIKSPKENVKGSDKHIVPTLRLTKSNIDIPKIVQKMQENRLKSIGLSPNTKLLPTSSLPQISENLSNIRKIKRKLFPKFNATRNHIKSIVDNMIQTKSITNSNNNLLPSSTTQIPQSDLQLEKKYIYSEEDIEDSKTSKAVENNNTESETEDSNATNETEESEMQKASAQIFDLKQSKEDFKLKLERVLSSPIHKVKKIPSVDSLLRTPVPTPRKKVMFDFPTKSNNDEFLLDEENEYSKDILK